MAGRKSPRRAPSRSPTGRKYEPGDVRSRGPVKPSAAKERRRVLDDLFRDESRIIRENVDEGFKAAAEGHDVKGYKSSIDVHLKGLYAFAKAMTKRHGPVGHPLQPSESNYPPEVHVQGPAPKPSSENTFTRAVEVSPEFMDFVKRAGLTGIVGEDLVKSRVLSRTLMGNLITLYTWEHGYRPKGLVKGMSYGPEFSVPLKKTIDEMKRRRPESYEYYKPNGNIGIIEAFSKGSMFHTDLPAIASLNVVKNISDPRLQAKVDAAQKRVRAEIEQYKNAGKKTK